MTRARDTAGIIGSNTLTIDGSSNIGIGSTIPGSKFHIGGNTRVSGVLTATTFSGNVTGTAATFTGNVSVAGVLTYEDVTNVDSLGLSTFRSGLIVQGTGSTTTTLNVSGVSTFVGVSTFGNQVGVNGGLAVAGSGVTATTLNITGIATFNSPIRVGNGITVTGITTFNNDVRFDGVIETVSAATTYIHAGAIVLELDVRNSTTYRYSMPSTGNIGIVSFKNMPADTENGSTVTVLFTQNSTTPAGVGNTTAATGIGTNCTIVPYVGGVAIAGISTRALVGSATTVTLSTTASDVDFVSFFVHYTGGTTSAAGSYKVYVTNNGGFRRGNVGV